VIGDKIAEDAGVAESLHGTVRCLDSPGNGLCRLFYQKWTQRAMLGSDKAVELGAVSATFQSLGFRTSVDLASIPGRELHFLDATLAFDSVEGAFVAELSTDTNDRH